MTNDTRKELEQDPLLGIHEGKKYTFDSETIHKQLMHEGKIYLCDTCDNEATTKGHLNTHKQRENNCKKCPCDSCEY